jgi:hypothetical protein
VKELWAKFFCYVYSNVRHLHLQLDAIKEWSEDYVQVGSMRNYPIIPPEAEPATIAVTANKGSGKSKEIYVWLREQLEIAPETSVCVVAANVALSRKYHQDLRDMNIGDFVCYSDSEETQIKAKQVVCCINSLCRLAEHYDILIMDEINTTLGNIHSAIMRNKKRVAMRLEAIARGAHALLACDADLETPMVLEWLQAVRTHASLYTIRNRGVWPTERTAVINHLSAKQSLSTQFDHIIEYILNLVERGARVHVSKKSYKSFAVRSFLPFCFERQML